MELGKNFNEMPEPENNFSPLPDGDYLVEIEGSEPKQSKTNSNNWYLEIKYSVIGADFTNRKIFEIFNFKNDNETAEKIASENLGQLARACGIKGSNSDEYIGRKLYIAVGTKYEVKKIKDYSGQLVPVLDANGKPVSEPRNFVKRRFEIEGGTMPAFTPPPQPQPPQKKPPFFGK